MDDELEPFRKRFEDERRKAELERTRREEERQRENVYERAWGATIAECDRLHASPEAQPILEPLEVLVKELASWQRLEWLAEMRDNFLEQLDRGLDTPAGERRAELWFVNVLLSLSTSPPTRDRALQLLTEMRQRGFSPFGIGSIARNVRDYVANHLGAMEQLRRQKTAEMLEISRPVVAEIAKGKPALRRNLQFAAWKDDRQMTAAAIRDTWNAANPDDRIGKGRPGVDAVKQGIRAAKRFLKDLAGRGFSLTAQQALDRLPG